MDYRELTEQQYYERLRTVITGAEGFDPRATDKNDGMATIGHGYVFNRHNNAEIWRDAGIQLTPAESAALAAIDAAPDGSRTRLGLAFPRTLNQSESEQLLRASMREYEGPANSLNMPLSDERVALMSLSYNRGTGALMGNQAKNVPEHPVMGAIRNGDRAEAWFHMRYNCWGSSDQQFEGGLRKRRFAEAHVFGLYDDPNNVSPDEARNVSRVYGLHRDEIDRVERNYGVTVDGTQATRNRIAEANDDYPALVREYGRVQNIADSLEPARQSLLSQARGENPDLAEQLMPGNFPAGRIHMDPNRNLQTDAEVTPIVAAMRNLRNPPRPRTIDAVDHEQRNSTTQGMDENHAATIDSRRMTREREPKEIASNDLLIGGGGNDTLRSHLGNDILIGGEGRDRMEGGIGHDVYKIGAGDTVMDRDGLGEVRWGQEQLTGGTRTESPNTYRSADGHFTYELAGGNLTTTDNRATDQAVRERAVITNFKNGQLGITLSEQSAGTRQQTPSAPAPAPDINASSEGRQSSRRPEQGPFNDPHLDRYYAAMVGGNSDLADRVAREFAQGPEGQRMAGQGDEPLARQLERQQAQEQELPQAPTRQSPVMR